MHEERGCLDLNDSETDSACYSEFDLVSDLAENFESYLETDLAYHSQADSEAHFEADWATDVLKHLVSDL